jgi:hypothetical protein
VTVATTLPELFDAVDRVANRVGVLADTQTRLADRLDELEELTIEAHTWLHEIHTAAFARSQPKPPAA